jgi:hypothetical protein
MEGQLKLTCICIVLLLVTSLSEDGALRLFLPWFHWNRSSDFGQKVLQGVDDTFAYA